MGNDSVDSGEFTSVPTLNSSSFGGPYLNGAAPPSQQSVHFAEYGMFLIGMSGIMGNGFVLYCFLPNKHLRTRVRNILIIHQSVVDFATSILFLMCYGSKAAQTKKFEGLSGTIVCALLDSEAPMWLFLCESTANLVLITVERYLMVIKPAFYRVRVTKYWIFCAMMASWFMTTALLGILFFYTSGVKEGACYVVGLWPSEQLERSFCIFYLVMTFLIPVTSFVGCYGHMLLVIRKRHKVLVSCHISKADRMSINVNYRRKSRITSPQSNLTKTMLIVSVCFVICWSPSHVHYLLTTFELVPHLHFYGRVYRIVTYLAFSNVCINPIIYAFKYEDFKNEAKRVLRIRDPDSSHSTTIDTSVSDTP